MGAIRYIPLQGSWEDRFGTLLAVVSRWFSSARNESVATQFPKKIAHAIKPVIRTIENFLEPRHQVPSGLRPRREASPAPTRASMGVGVLTAMKSSARPRCFHTFQLATIVRQPLIRYNECGRASVREQVAEMGWHDAIRLTCRDSSASCRQLYFAGLIARRSASVMYSLSASLPVKYLYCIAACSTNMSLP